VLISESQIASLKIWTKRGALPHIKIWMKKSRIRLPYGKKKGVADGVEYASKKSGG